MYGRNSRCDQSRSLKEIILMVRNTTLALLLKMEPLEHDRIVRSQCSARLVSKKISLLEIL